MIFTLITLLLIIIDQASKIAVLKYLKPISTTVVIKDILSLTYVENRGAAFGILQNSRWLFIIFTVVVIAVLIAYTIKKKISNKLYKTSSALIISGGIGNLIDRIFRGYVVDMIEVTFINYPVFNFADCCVVVGAILFCLYVLIYDGKTEKTDGNTGI